ncbi:alcohol dehydrogenase catalytic domain-containing protein [Blastococcus montanus]
MCHTDLLVRNSRPESLPAVLGHESAGIVREAGSESATSPPATRRS